jgi:hypothetical protein
LAILGRPLWGRHQGHLHRGRSPRPQGAEDEGQLFSLTISSPL